MEKVIEQIKQTEEAAAKKIDDANARANEIALASAKEEEALRIKYELGYKGSSAVAMNSAKEQISELKAKEEERFIGQREELRQKTRAALPACADYVFEYIIKEFTE